MVFDDIQLVNIVSAAVLAFVSCSQGESSKSRLAIDDPTAELPARFKSQEPVSNLISAQPPVSRIPAGELKDVTALVWGPATTFAVTSRASGSERRCIVRRSAGESRSSPGERHTRILLSKGFYLFRYEQNFDITTASPTKSVYCPPRMSTRSWPSWKRTVTTTALAPTVSSPG